ncbi:MAG: hypothetical protein ABI451_09455 [Dokdonella sp.]
MLDTLCCPRTHAPLRLLRADELAALNNAIRAGRMVCANGGPVVAAVVAALSTPSGDSIYRIDDGIPVLLKDQAIVPL